MLKNQIYILLILLGTISAQEGEVVIEKNAPLVCAISGQTADSTVHFDYNDKRYFFCCAGCLESFKKDPATHAVKFENTRGTAPDSVDVAEKRTYEVFGMDCPGCHGGLEKLVKKIPGVVTAKANWRTKTIIVSIADRKAVTDEQIFKAIKKANFTPGERK